VNFPDGNETEAYYTDNLEDAVNAAVEMTRKRGQVRSIIVAIVLMKANMLFAAVRDHLKRLPARAVPLDGAAP